MGTFSPLAGMNTALVRKALTGGLIAAPVSAPVLNRSNLFVTDGGLITAWPTGYRPGGITTDDGIRMARSQENEDITGWQYREPVRSDQTSDVETIQVDFLETNRATIEWYTGADLSAATKVNGAISIQKPDLPPSRYYRMLSLAVDAVDGDEMYTAIVYPRVKVTTWADQAFAKSGGLQWGMTFTSYVDPVLRYAKDTMIGGPGFARLQTAMGFTFA